MPQPALSLQNVHKAYGKTHAVRGLSFQIPAGSLVALLGPNGAGKSTTMAMLGGLLKPDQGQLLVLGFDMARQPRLAKAKLGVAPQDIAVYEDLTAEANLRFWGRLHGLKGEALARRIDTVLHEVELSSRRKDKPATFSGGMKRRLNLAIALLHEPPILILDEPTVGIDPHSRRRILDLIGQHHAAGTTVLLSTHMMEEAQDLAERVLIMDHGAILADGTVQDLLNQVRDTTQVTIQLAAPCAGAVAAANALDEVSEARGEGDTLHIRAASRPALVPRLLTALNQAGADVTDVHIAQPNLESVFLNLTGRALRDGDL